MTKKEFLDKVAKIQRDMKAPKNQLNKFGGYNFRNKEDILEAVKPFLDGLIMKIDDEVINVGKYNYIKSTATLTDLEHSVSATSTAREAEEQKGMNASQLTGSTNSYAGKYAAGNLLLLDDTKDSDATNTHGKEATTLEKTTPATKPEPTTQQTEGAASQAPEKKGFGKRFGSKAT